MGLKLGVVMDPIEAINYKNLFLIKIHANQLKLDI